MKKKIIFSVFTLLNVQIQAQTDPNGSGGTNSGSGWWRGGNTQGNGANIMATTWNSPIYWYTDGYAGGNNYQANRLRMKLNGTFDGTNQYDINSYTTGINTSGYLGLGYTSNGLNGNLWAQQGPYSLLHLNGRNGTFVQELGYRPWMQAGITLTDNQDLSYMGMRRVGTGFDVTETVIAWSDNPSSNNGPDDFAIRFMGGSGNTAISTTNLQETGDLDGLHVARFAGTGEFGLGNTFGINAPGTPNNLYVRPQSLAHYSLSNYRSVWQQFTNRNTTTGSGTGETASDGLRIGIIGHTNTNVNGTAAIYNQEARALLLSTNANTNGVNLANGATRERVRIMSVGTPTNLAAGGIGNYNPGNAGANFTRMSISHNPAQPVTRPLSLLHLGYNTGLNSNPAGSTDGWRSWMDIGTFTSNGTDNVYVGLKAEGTDRSDAVVSWGDNQSAGPVSNEGPDNLRFIFTSTTTSVTNPGDPVSTSPNGLEVTRMHPGQASTLTNNFGMVGIGNFAPNGPNTAAADVVDAKLDIDGDLRIRTVTEDNSLTQVLVIDPTDHNRVHWADANLLGGGTVQANNGTSVSATDFVVLGQDYQEAGDPAQLLNDREIPMRGQNILYTDEGRIGIGDGFSNLALTPEAKLDIRPTLTDQKGIVVENSADFSTVPIYEMNSLYNATTGTSEMYGLGIYMDGSSVKRSTGLIIENETATSSCFGIEVVAQADDNQTNTGGLFGAFGVSGGNTGISSSASGSTNGNTGGQFRAGNPGSEGQNGTYNVGVRTSSISGQNSIGIMATATGGTVNNYAAHLTGDVYANGSIVSTSDINLKENIQSITNASQTLNNLNPVSFDYKQNGIYERMHMPENMQYGLIAQEVEPLLPTLIKQGHYPAEYDSLGNETVAAIDFKTMNYDGLIPILIKGHQEQSTVIDSLQTVNDSLQNQIDGLNDRLSQLENCLSGILPFLCRLSQQSIEQNGLDTQEQLRQIIEVELSNGEAIVLNQNVPNPFAESTVITYSIPSSVQTAQIIFHDATGALIKSLDIRERGDGQINVYANDLSTGTYTYSLIADGKIVATKRMLKQ